MIFACETGAIHYVSVGEGPALVLLHGLGGQLENWTHQMAGLARTIASSPSICPAMADRVG